MTDLLASVVWAGVAVYAIRQAVALAHRWLSLHEPPPDEATPAVVELPADIEALASRESALWAQEDVRKVARERFDALRQSALSDAQRWNLVRKALGVGTID